MHDILAHTLSALSIQLESARLLVEQRPGDLATLAAVERAGKLAREGLEEARRAVGSLRGDTLPGPDLLGKLATDFEQDTGIPVHLEVEGTARDLPVDGRLALYRVAQEALTNVRKHADATSVYLKLRYDDNAAELTVENEGQERPSPVVGGGFGLSGMRERAELLGGRLEAGPTEHGFRVQLWIPT
jgi:signal transduction histidine kinase